MAPTIIGARTIATRLMGIVCRRRRYPVSRSVTRSCPATEPASDAFTIDTGRMNVRKLAPMSFSKPGEAPNAPVYTARKNRLIARLM